MLRKRLITSACAAAILMTISATPARAQGPDGFTHGIHVQPAGRTAGGHATAGRLHLPLRRSDEVVESCR